MVDADKNVEADDLAPWRGLVDRFEAEIGRLPSSARRA